MKLRNVLLLCLTCALTPACKKEAPPAPVAVETKPAPPPEPVVPPAPALAPMPKGLPEMEVPADVALTPEKVALGKQLFFDKRLSGNASKSCESCHQHERAWTDGQVLSMKGNDQLNTRHSPSMYNIGFQPHWYWDGRATNLEAQALAAWKGQVGGDPAKVSAFLMEIPAYRIQFLKVFGSPPTPETISAALAAFMRTLNSGDSDWDKHEAGVEGAVSEDAIAGWKIFSEKAHCTLCHVPPLFTDFQFHNVGIGMEAKEPDLGRFKISNEAKDTGAFKTPGLRSVIRSAPYFHDGSVVKLEDAVKLMLAGGKGDRKKNKFLDAKLKKVTLTDKEFAQLMAFIESLDSDEKFERPTLP
jgi:cytochrome c peroxidase